MKNLNIIRTDEHHFELNCPNCEHGMLSVIIPDAGWREDIDNGIRSHHGAKCDCELSEAQIEAIESECERRQIDEVWK
jgi:hypothetical protein